jgi:hypothetical protein
LLTLASPGGFLSCLRASPSRFKKAVIRVKML